MNHTDTTTRPALVAVAEPNSDEVPDVCGDCVARRVTCGGGCG